jgi:hypothetical protein
MLVCASFRSLGSSANWRQACKSEKVEGWQRSDKLMRAVSDIETMRPVSSLKNQVAAVASDECLEIWMVT